MKKCIFLIIIAVLLSCSEDNIEEDSIVYTTVRGNTYIAKSVSSWNPSNLLVIYKMGKDSTILIEERLNSVHGELQEQSKGIYHYDHPVLKLKVQSISGCEECFNFFTATVDDDRESFSYEIWDMGVSKTKEITFNIVSEN